MTKTKKLSKREATLLYLQEEALELRKNVPNLADAQLEEDTLVLTVTGEVTEAPKLSYKGVDLTVVVRAATEESKPVAEISEAAKRAQAIRNRHGVVPFDSLHIPRATTAIGPDGNGERRDSSAYGDWKKRHGKK
jgi:hypothetical protein